MESYEKSIGLKTIWLTFARRWKLILVIFIPIALGAFIVTRFMLKTTYSSSAVITTNSALDINGYNRVKNEITKDEVYESAAYSLKENSITHAGGAEITATDIKSGITFTAFTSGIYIPVSFTTSEQGIAQNVLEAYATSAKEKAKTLYNASDISTHASTEKAESDFKKYFLIALAADLVLALGIPFVQEILDDEVYDRKDIEMLGSEGFELSTTGASSVSENK